MRNRDHIAFPFTAEFAIDALALERAPEPLRGGCLDVGGWELLSGIARKDDIAVDVLTAWHAGPLVTDEGRKAARRTAIVVGFGRLPRDAPRAPRCRDASAAAFAAEGIPRRVFHRIGVPVDQRVAERGQ